ncbi:MAG: hypothetical protein U0360_06595 [Dehalococcoidia bacterium]
MKFHNVAPANGREFDVTDVLALYNRYKAGGSQVDVFKEVAAFETPDNYTLVEVTQPLVDFPRNLAACRSSAEGVSGRYELPRQHAVGTGPFLQQE